MIQQNLEAEITRWLSRFEEALSASDALALADLFHADSHWRDVLALTWRIETVSGRDAVVQALHARLGTPSRIAVDTNRMPAREVVRAGAGTIEAIFRFETA